MLIRTSTSARLLVRRGATVVETAIVSVVFLSLILGIFDLGIAVFQYNAIAEAARMGARNAIVHGSQALQPWNTGASAGNNIQTLVQPFLESAGVQSFQVAVTYLDGGNAPDNRVRVTVSATYQPATTLFLSAPINLSSTATMAITH